MSPLSTLLFRGVLICGLVTFCAFQLSEGVIFAIGLGLGVLSAPFALRRPWLLWRLEKAPLRRDVRAVLEGRIRQYRQLPSVDQDGFQRRVERLLATLDFESVGGATFDLEARVLAVAGAALIVQGRPEYRFHTQRAVLLYPDHFEDDYAVAEDGHILGMVHLQGPIVFSRRALLEGWDRDADGHNVSIHEWAHVLDFDDGFADGIPGFALGEGWDELLEDERRKAERAHRTALRRYAGTNRAETFATAVEVFFERPAALKAKNAEFYELLAQTLKQRP